MFPKALIGILPYHKIPRRDQLDILMFTQPRAQLTSMIGGGLYSSVCHSEYNPCCKGSLPSIAANSCARLLSNVTALIFTHFNGSSLGLTLRPIRIQFSGVLVETTFSRRYTTSPLNRPTSRFGMMTSSRFRWRSRTYLFGSMNRSERKWQEQG